ncbi:MAG: single-stranded DNA-binding protein [Defluviitaleaceae bacterium]|nr:single-stranded DNA-binding protein [Defluviitaleaceae bacterium]
MNKVILIGRLTRDPEVRYSQNAEPIAIARYNLAVSRRFKKDGEPDADFINCVSFGKQAEFIEKYFKKGMQIAVTGRLNVRSYDDATGQRRWSTDVVVEDAEFTESRSAYEARMSQQSPQYQSNFDSMAEQYTPPASPMGGESPMGMATSAPSAPEGFAAITESIDDDDLPF